MERFYFVYILRSLSYGKNYPRWRASLTRATVSSSPDEKIIFLKTLPPMVGTKC
jgi:hypothetical protein